MRASINRSLLVALTLTATFATTLVIPSITLAKVDLVTLPVRDKVQITIYNSADLTLARDIRSLTMKKGQNRLQFSWAGTLIDPTSLELLPLADARNVQVQDLQYPPRWQRTLQQNPVSRFKPPFLRLSIGAPAYWPNRVTKRARMLATCCPMAQLF